jgi:uncharacterized membrane protein YidH (DUF202 family)
VSGGPDPGAGVWDRGLQPERTSLAWERTALGLAANAALLLRAGAQGAPFARVLGAVTLGVAGAVFLASRTRYVRRDAALRGRGRAPGGRLVLAVGVTTVALSLGALVAVLGLAAG